MTWRDCKKYLGSLLVLLLSAGTAAGGDDPAWSEIVRAARGQTVDWYMWGGSPSVNTLVNGLFAKELKEKYDITLRQVPVKDIAEVVGKLVVEKQAGKTGGGSVDLMWINGENFRTCKSHGLLYGPFADRLPNQALVDWQNAAIANDFGTPVEGMESPWGSAQVVMIYDSARTPEPPKTIAALIEWIRRHPGRFTYPAPPDFTGSAFIRHLFYHVGQPAAHWQGPYSSADLDQASQATYALLNELKPYLWRQGTTYPDSPVRLDSLFADGEIDFSFSYQQSAASRGIVDGLMPATTRSYVFDDGTIANTHFVAIPFNATDRAAAMVVANYLLSPEAQLAKADPEIWGDFPIIDPRRLAPDWQKRFAARPRGPATLTDQELQARQLPEPPSAVLIHLEKGWQGQVLKAR